MHTALALERTEPTPCVDCGKPWSMVVPEREWWLNRIKTRPGTQIPSRCLWCRKQSKVMGQGCLSSAGKAKARYDSLAEAEFTEERHRAERGYDRQYAYECPDCSGFHLKSSPPNDVKGPQIAQMRYDNLYAKPNDEHGRGPEGETREKVRELVNSGLTGAEIAKKLGHNRSNIYYHLRKLKDAPTSSPIQKTSKSLADIASARLKLEEDLKRVAAQEEYLTREQERLKREELLSIIHNAGEYSVRKKAQRMSFTVDSFRELIQGARQHEELRMVLSEAA